MGWYFKLEWVVYFEADLHTYHFAIILPSALVEKEGAHIYCRRRRYLCTNHITHIDIVEVIGRCSILMTVAVLFMDRSWKILDLFLSKNYWHLGWEFIVLRLFVDYIQGLFHIM